MDFGYEVIKYCGFEEYLLKSIGVELFIEDINYMLFIVEVSG